MRCDTNKHMSTIFRTLQVSKWFLKNQRVLSFCEITATKFGGKDKISYGYIIIIIVDSCVIWFHFDCITQLKKSYHIISIMLLMFVAEKVLLLLVISLTAYPRGRNGCFAISSSILLLYALLNVWRSWEIYKIELCSTIWDYAYSQAKDLANVTESDKGLHWPTRSLNLFTILVVTQTVIWPIAKWVVQI